MTTKAEVMSRIRKHCIECMGGQIYLVDGCTSPNCELFPFRMGQDPEPNISRQKAGKELSRTQVCSGD
jgi:hypothetical protein